MYEQPSEFYDILYKVLDSFIKCVKKISKSPSKSKSAVAIPMLASGFPSLFTAIIVRYMGLTRMMLLGVVLFFISIIIAFASHALTNYWWSLVLLGLGWNFLFIGGTNLLSRSYNENEKFKVQSINDFLVFGLQALAALSAGWFVFNFSWEVVLLSVIPLLFMQFALLLWWLKKKD